MSPGEQNRERAQIYREPYIPWKVDGQSEGWRIVRHPLLTPLFTGLRPGCKEFS
jgi:hypothetical protein